MRKRKRKEERGGKNWKCTQSKQKGHLHYTNKHALFEFTFLINKYRIKIKLQDIVNMK